MARIRVLITGVPRLLRDILAGVIEAEPDLELAADSGPEDLATAIARERPHVVLVAERDGGAAVAAAALDGPAGRLHVLVMTGVAPDLKAIHVTDLSPGDVSPADVVRTIRAAFSSAPRG